MFFTNSVWYADGLWHNNRLVEQVFEKLDERVPIGVSDAVEGERGRVRYSPSVLDAGVRHKAGAGRVVHAAVHLYGVEGAIRVRAIFGVELIHIPLARVLIDANNREPVQAILGGDLICIRLIQLAQDCRYDLLDQYKPRRHGLPQRRLRLRRSCSEGPAWCLRHHPRGDEVRRWRDRLDVCVQQRGDRVANRAYYRFVRLRIPVELIRRIEELVCLGHGHVGDLQPGAAVRR